MTEVPEPHGRQGLPALHELLAVAEEAVDEAVGWLSSAGAEWSATRFKAFGEEVTDADVEVEARVTRVLEARTPEIPVVGEESAAAPDAPLPSRCWLLDPIDGTMNFTRGAPMYAVSLAYAENGVPLLGWCTPRPWADGGRPARPPPARWRRPGPSGAPYRTRADTGAK